MQIVNECMSAITPMVRSKVPPDDVPDVLQDIRLSLYASIPRYRGEAKIETYANVIARRRVVDYYRRRERGRKEIEAAKEIRAPVDDVMESDYVWLSAREREVLYLMSYAVSNAVIAETMRVSVNTIRSHIKSIREKLGIKTRPQMVLFAYKIFSGGNA